MNEGDGGVQRKRRPFWAPYLQKTEKFSNTYLCEMNR
jgi:hypothetical protein